MVSYIAVISVHTQLSVDLCNADFSIIIDNIDYVTGIGNSSREQYIRAGQSVTH